MKPKKNVRKKKRKTSYQSYVDKPFIILPRLVFTRLYADDEMERLIGRMYLTLLLQAYHTDGVALVGENEIPCRKGEYFGSLRCLSDLMRVSYSTVHRLLKRLVEEGLISITKSVFGTHITVIGYAEITRSTSVKEKEMTPGQALAAYEERLMKGIVYA